MTDFNTNESRRRLVEEVGFSSLEKIRDYFAECNATHLAETGEQLPLQASKCFGGRALVAGKDGLRTVMRKGIMTEAFETWRLATDEGRDTLKALEQHFTIAWLAADLERARKDNERLRAVLYGKVGASRQPGGTYAQFYNGFFHSIESESLRNRERSVAWAGEENTRTRAAFDSWRQARDSGKDTLEAVIAALERYDSTDKPIVREGDQP